MALIVLLLSSSSAVGQELPFTHYTQNNEIVPLPSADVRTVYQDRLGYIWFVVYSSGLLRYNGHKTDIYTKEDGLPNLTVRQILEDHLRRLWVVTDVGLAVSRKPLNEYTGNQRIGFSTKIGATELVKTAIVENRLAVDTQRRLWIGTREDGIIRYCFTGLDSVVADTVRTDIDSEGKNKDVRSITVRRDGSVWVGVGGGDLLVFSRESATYDVLTEKDGVPRFETDALYESRSGKLWGGCRNGLLWHLVEGAGQRRVAVFSEELKRRISCISGTQDGKLWVASEGSGMMSITDGNLQVPQSRNPLRHVILTQRNGLLSDNVNYIIEDREGNLWFAQLGGVAKLRLNYAAFTNYPPTSHFGEKPILSNPSFNAVLPPAGGAAPSGIWVGTSGAGVALIEDGKIESVQTDRGLRENWVNGLVRDERGRIWIGTADGINCLAFDFKNPPPPSPEVQSISILNRKGIIAAYEHHTIYACQNLPLPEDKEKSIESIWFPGYQHLYCFVGNEWFLFRTASGLPAALFHTVAFDEAGRLLVGTRDRGLYRSKEPLTLARLQRLQANEVEFPGEKGGGKFGREIITPIFEPVWNQSTGAPSNQIERLFWRDGILWVGTTEGLSILEGDPPRMATHLTMEHGLRANNITSMEFSPVTNTLWVGTNGGLAEIDPQTRKVIRTVTKQDGLVDNEVWFYGSVAIDAEGTVYFGTAKGLAVYRPQFDKPNPVLPTLRLERADFTEDNRGDNEIAFEYAALSFANEKQVRYKTRLVGYDKDWSEEKAEVKIRYTNLPAFLFPKEYTFEVLAANNAGLWTEIPRRHAFAVQPPWWFRWWWLASNMGFLVALVYGFSRYRVRQLEKRSLELEKIVEERTQEIRLRAEENRRQAEELAEKNQEIIRTQEQLIMQEKLASLGALTAGVAHEIRNPLNFVNNFAQLSKELTQALQQDLVAQEARLDPKVNADIKESIRDLQHNMTKINEHGKRIDGIVRGMLLHSQGKSEKPLLTDINALLDEYAHLAYHGLQAQDPSLQVTIKTDYDPSIEHIEVVPQDISRAFFNMVNNACYAANEKRKIAPPPFVPTVSVGTRNLDGKVEIRIRDNGHGIPKNVIDKIFNPFFTTKPAGKGVGLGLSLSYEVVVKGHRGEIKVETEEGEFAEFIITLPKHNSVKDKTVTQKAND